MNSFDLSGRVAIVTGAASGQGRATVLALRAAGALVMAADVDSRGLAQLEADAEGVVAKICDVSREADVAALVEEAEQRFGAVHAMLNCAGVLLAAPLEQTTEETLDLMMNINLKGTFFGCKYAAPAIRRAGGGSIVNWGSVNSLVAEPDLAAYSASKGAILMLTKSAAIELAKDDIRVNSICPGGVRTPMVAGFFGEDFLEDEAGQRDYQPLGLIQPNEIADVAVFLVAEASRKITGTHVVVDGGYTAL